MKNPYTTICRVKPLKNNTEEWKVEYPNRKEKERWICKKVKAKKETWVCVLKSNQDD